ncbi:MAG: LysM peptidoglycan-binding domain-containing protein [Candidatus Omnitrophota bacterium]
MRKEKLFFTVGLLLFLTLSGCTVRSYKQTRDRVDQDLNSGNRGYLEGESSGEKVERKSTRTTRVVEVELGGKSIKFEKGAQDVTPKEKTDFVEQAYKAEDEVVVIKGKEDYLSESIPAEEAKVKGSSDVSFEKYTIQKNDTLQKISQRFYGTTKKWMKIYEANQGVLTSPDKLIVGQVINIPLEQSAEAGESLK